MGIDGVPRAPEIIFEERRPANQTSPIRKDAGDVKQCLLGLLWYRFMLNKSILIRCFYIR